MQCPVAVLSSMHGRAALALALLLASCAAPAASPGVSPITAPPSASAAQPFGGAPSPNGSDPAAPSHSASPLASGMPGLTGQVAYVAGADPQIHLLDLATGATRQLTALLPEHAELSAMGPLRPALSCGFGPYGLTWSPGGDFLAFSYGSCESVVYVIDLDGNLRRVGDGHGPAWSPDGTRLVHSINIAYSPCGADCLPDVEPGAADLRILDLAGGGESRPLTVDGSTAFASSAVWSPDGSMIAYSAPPPSGSPPEMFGATYLIDAGGGAPRLVGSGAYPMGWQSDGRLLVRMEGDSTIRAVDVETGQSSLVAPPETATVSPDGALFVTNEFESDSGEQRAVLRDAAGRSLATVRGHGLAWAPDSTALAATEPGEIVILGRGGSLLGRYPVGNEGTFGGSGAWRPGS